MRTWMIVVRSVAILLSWAGMSYAAAPEFPGKTYGPFTLNAAAPTNFPSDAGQRISDFDSDCTTQIILTTGTISVDVEASLDKSGGWYNIGTLTGSHMDSLKGPIDLVRFHVTACGSSCVATATIRCRSGQ